LFGETAVADLPHEAERGAEIVATGDTVPAMTAEHTGIGHHQVAAAETIRRSFQYFADKFMPRRDRQFAHPLAGAEIMQVRPADTGRQHFETHLTRRGDGRVWHTLEPYIADTMKAQRLHFFLHSSLTPNTAEATATCNRKTNKCSFLPRNRR
jgi:hypothetical protein